MQGSAMAKVAQLGTINARTLKRHVEILEGIEEEMRETLERRTAAFADAKDDGLDPVTLRELLRQRRLTADTRYEHMLRRDRFELYWKAMGMTPIEDLESEAKAKAEAEADEAEAEAGENAEAEPEEAGAE